MNLNNPLVSVIINCYNGDKYLEEAIDSVIAQTYTNWEIIFWDNQSQDKSAEIVNSYNDKRIKYFYAPKHSLLGEARNSAIGKASGEWIGILDCDDVWNKNKLELQLKDVSDDTGMVYSRMQFVVEQSGSDTLMAKSINGEFYPKIEHLPSGSIFDELLYDCFIPCPSVLFRKDLFFKVGCINESLKVAEDYDIFLKLAKISNVLSVDSNLCAYRIHGTNLSHRNDDITFKESIGLVNSYSNHKYINDYVIYWKFKYFKNLFKRRLFFQAILLMLSINPLYGLLMLKRKYLRNAIDKTNSFFVR